MDESTANLKIDLAATNKGAQYVARKTRHLRGQHEMERYRNSLDQLHQQNVKQPSKTRSWKRLTRIEFKGQVDPAPGRTRQGACRVPNKLEENEHQAEADKSWLIVKLSCSKT